MFHPILKFQYLLRGHGPIKFRAVTRRRHLQPFSHLLDPLQQVPHLIEDFLSLSLPMGLEQHRLKRQTLIKPLTLLAYRTPLKAHGGACEFLEQIASVFVKTAELLALGFLAGEGGESCVHFGQLVFA